MDSLSNEEAALLCNVATDLAKAGDRRSALEMCENVLDRRPDYAHAHLVRASMAMGERAWPLARPHLEKALALGGSGSALHAKLGEVLLHLGEVDGAVDHLGRAGGGDVSAQDAFANRARMLLPVARHLRDRVREEGPRALEAALARAQNFLTSDPDDAPTEATPTETT